MKTCVRIAAYAAAIFLLTGCLGGGLFISTQDGDWNDGGTWGNNSPGQSGNDYLGFNDDVVISSGTTVFHTTGESPRRVRINSNGELSTEGVLRVRGSYVNDGIHSGNNDIILKGNNDSIFGNGIISTIGLFDVTTFRQIYSGSSLTRSGGDVDCPNNSSISNQGIFTLTNGVNITGSNNATFINAAGGVLYAGGEITVGTLIASENSNTVIYSRTDGTAKPIAISQNGYYNLSTEGKDTLDVKTLDSDEDILGNLKLNGGLLRPLDSINLSIVGDFTMAPSADFDPVTNQANVIMNGSAAQTIKGDFVFDDLAIQASGTVSVVNDTIEILHELAPSSGTLNTNGLLLMRSRAIGDSRIDNVTGSVNGDVTVQRYIEAGQTGWRFLSAPVKGATLADWNDDFITSGFPGSNFPSFYFTSIMFYDETEVGHQDSGFVFPTSINNSIPVSSSAWVYCGDSLQGTAPFMIDVTGPINSGDLTYPISYSNNTSATADGWNHVSNPYVSAIDWDAAGWAKTNVDAGVYIWNTDLNIYASYVGGIGVSGGSNVIASSQGFTLKPMQSRLP